MCEDDLGTGQPVRADRRGQEGRGDGAERHGHPYDRLEVLGDPGPPELLGLLVQQGVAGVGRDARGGAGEQREEQHGRHVRDEPGQQQREPGDR